MTTTLLNNLNIKKLSYYRINYRYARINYLDIECILDMMSGYINATKFCFLASNQTKSFKNYINDDRYKNLIEYMRSSPVYTGEQLTIRITDGDNELRGLYLHTDLLLDLSSWISPVILIKTTKILNELRIVCDDNEIKRLNKDNRQSVDMFFCDDIKCVIIDNISIEEKGKVGVETKVGFIDVLNNNKIIVVEKYNLWKCALGQIKSYGYFYPNRQKWIYLYGIKNTDNVRELINDICNSENVFVKFI